MKEIEIEISNDNLAKAEKICLELLDKNEFDLTGLFYKAIINRKQENYTTALETHNTLINLIPGNAEYLAERGLTYHMLKDAQQALNDFNKAVELEPENPYRYASRAFIKDYYGDHYGALDDYDKAIELDPEDAISLNNRGIIEEKIGRLDDAKKSFDQSDVITGVDKKIQEVTGHDQPAPVSSSTELEEKNESIVTLFFKTVKSLITSQEERRSFLKYLGGNRWL